jgi:hypothetical protein
MFHDCWRLGIALAADEVEADTLCRLMELAPAFQLLPVERWFDARWQDDDDATISLQQ